MSNGKIKVLYILPAGLFNSAGMERVTTIKANYLAELPDYQVSIVTTEQMGRRVFYPLSEKIRLFHLDIGIYKNFGKEPYLQKCVSRFRKTREYKKALKNLLYEIHQDITISTLGLEMGFLNNLKDGSIKIGELHFPGNFRRLMARNLSKNPIPNIIAQVRNHELQQRCKKLSRLIVLTEEEKTFWENQENIRVIPNPLPFVSETISSTENKKVIAVGRLNYEKGFDLLIEAWKAVYSKHSDWKLDIYGKGIQREELIRLIRKNQLESVIKIHEPVAKIETVYPEYSLLVFPTRYLDSFGMVMIEAMSCGLPVVAFNSPCGPKDLISNGDNGFLVEAGDTVQLAEKINQLIESDDLRKRMGRTAREASFKYSIDKVMEQWLSLFKELKNETGMIKNYPNA
jgi:glycosyltransferase involved in cell wall biosynthesis